MDLSVHNEIFEIFCKISNDPQYHSIWKEYSDSYTQLYEWMDSLSEVDWSRIDDYVQAFFEIHMQMMIIALREYKK